MPWGVGKASNSGPQISTGEQYQCDCTASGCSCTAWGYWVPAGQPVPPQVRCTRCLAGNHPN